MWDITPEIYRSVGENLSSNVSTTTRLTRDSILTSNYNLKIAFESLGGVLHRVHFVQVSQGMPAFPCDNMLYVERDWCILPDRIVSSQGFNACKSKRVRKQNTFF